MASFGSEARGVMFYGGPSLACVGSDVRCQLVMNPHDDNAVGLVAGSSMWGHLAREDAVFLAPLLRTGFEATGLVTNYLYTDIQYYTKQGWIQKV